MLQSVGSQRGRHDLATEKQQKEHSLTIMSHVCCQHMAGCSGLWHSITHLSLPTVEGEEVLRLAPQKRKPAQRGGVKAMLVPSA